MDSAGKAPRGALGNVAGRLAEFVAMLKDRLGFAPAALDCNRAEWIGRWPDVAGWFERIAGRSSRSGGPSEPREAAR